MHPDPFFLFAFLPWTLYLIPCFHMLNSSLRVLAGWLEMFSCKACEAEE